MAQGVKDFQKNFTREVHSIRDEWNMFELNLGEFKKNLKACVPNSVSEIRTLKVGITGTSRDYDANERHLMFTGSITCNELKNSQRF